MKTFKVLVCLIEFNHVLVIKLLVVYLIGFYLRLLICTCYGYCSISMCSYFTEEIVFVVFIESIIKNRVYLRT
jgi:hypothetical protein